MHQRSCTQACWGQLCLDALGVAALRCSGGCCAQARWELLRLGALGAAALRCTESCCAQICWGLLRLGALEAIWGQLPLAQSLHLSTLGVVAHQGQLHSQALQVVTLKIIITNTNIHLDEGTEIDDHNIDCLETVSLKSQVSHSLSIWYCSPKQLSILVVCFKILKN